MVRPTMLLVALLLCLLSGSTIAIVAEPGYSYGGAKGPLHWGEMKPEWKECREGKAQSPIAIHTKHTVKRSYMGGLHGHYNHTVVCSVSSTPYIFKVFVSGARVTLPLNSTSYVLTDFHFHAPSEHTIDGVRYPLELHLVHKNPENPTQIAVVSKLFKLGQPSSLLDHFLDFKGQNTTLHLSNHIHTHGGYYRYIGSLTTPPCSQGIVWTIIRKRSTVSPSQIQKVVEILQGRNARPLQSINSRNIYRDSS